MAFQFMPGATAVGISYTNGVVLAAEKRVSFGNFVVNKNTKKTFPVTEKVGAACARHDCRYASSCETSYRISQDSQAGN